MTVKLALRNAFRHGKSSLLILFFMTLTGMVFMTGNSLLVSVNRAMREGFRDNITADAVIMAPSRERMSLFGATVPSLGEFFSLPSLKNKGDLEGLISEAGYSSTPLISGNALMEGGGHSRGIPFFGIENSSYFALFPEVEILEGKADWTGPGALVSQSLAMEWEKETGRSLTVGDSIKFTTAGDIGFTIRRVSIKGIYRYPYEHRLTDSLVLLDDGTARDLVRVLADQTQESSPEEASDLLDIDLGSLFEMDDTSADGGSEDILSSLDALFDEPLPEVKSDGSWHFLLVRFPRTAYNKQLEQLRSLLNKETTQLLDWRQAAGSAAQYARFMQLFFYAGFFLIFLAAVLGIVNIMLISLFQRTVEIGTIQALGGTSSFVRRLLSFEYLFISLCGGLLSLIFSAGLFALVNRLDVVLANPVLSMVFGGKPLYFPFSLPMCGITLLVCIGTGWMSSLYPVGKALALEPVSALKGGNHE
ncbi:MAG: hypothetical protein PQJ59_03155 [Spirochaetales bacterium]|nr:hypothetical protein [Spirochaetales bacterium]